MVQQILGTNTFTTAKWIVSATASDGTHTTIAAALTSASSGDTIFIRPGTYTENLTLKAGVNLASFEPLSAFYTPSTSNVIINGTCTFTGVGKVGISGIVLQTNSAAALAVTGNAASIVILDHCYLNCLNNTGITFSSSSASALIQLQYCSGDLGTTGIGIFAHSSAGNLRFLHTSISNTGTSLTASTVSGTGGFFPNFSSMANGVSLSSSSAMVGDFLDFTMSGNQTAITTANTSTFSIFHAQVASGTASAISLGAGTSGILHYAFLSSSNASTVAGTGTLTFSNLTFNSVASLAAGLTLSNATANSFISGAGVGTANQLFTSNGVTSPPTWQTPALQYSQGSFTPGISFAGGTTGITYGAQSGYYTKIGNAVLFRAYVALSSKGSSTGSAFLTGLPFTATTNSSFCSTSAGFWQGITLTPLYTTVSLQPNPTTTAMYIQQMGSAQAGAAITDTGFSNTALLIVTGVYFVD